MKLYCFLVGICACGAGYAQQIPAPPPGPAGGTLPGISVLRPEYAPPAAPPSAPMAADSLGTAQELKELIRAQTEAIRVLSGKVDSLEDRLRRIESRMR